MNKTWLIGSAIALLLVGCDDGKATAKSGNAKAYAGTFSGDGVTVHLAAQDEGALTGSISIGDKRFPAKGTLQGESLKGVFKSGDKVFDFELHATDKGLELVSDGTTYQLTKADNPLAAGSKAEDSGDGDKDDEDEDGEKEDGEDEGEAAVSGGGKPSGGKAEPTHSDPKKATGFDGTFKGDISGTPSTVRLTQSGSRLSGSIDAGGYGYKLSGTVSGSSASGTLVDSNNGASIPFQGSISGTTFQLRFAGVSLSFHRAGGGKAAAAARGDGSQASAGSRNPALVGLWSRTDSLVSGGASMSTKYYLRVNGNGTFETGAGESAGGGGGWSFGGGGGVEITGRGTWKTQGNVVYVSEGGAFHPYARFALVGGKLMFTFANGKREIWYRN